MASTKFTFARNHFLTGMMVLIPLAVIVWLANILFRILLSVYTLFPTEWRNEILSSPLKPVFFLALCVTLFLLVTFLGWASKNYIGNKVLELLRKVIQRIPVLGTIYSSLDQLTRSFVPGGSKQFSRVVYLEYPRKDSWALGFVTGQSHNTALKGNHLNVFVPTVPNPTSGFHLIVPESDVKESGLTVEQAFKTILSLGLADNKNTK